MSTYIIDREDISDFRRSLSLVSAKFSIGDRVTKTRGSSWTGRVVGFYGTDLTPIGYAVESETKMGSVQIYPEHALTTKELGR